ncbi:MAG: AsnC family transcriptional regulator [Chloroflexi bacterium]|jgi:Lrp/AsnC family transcriptional regulator for asnA, asnC and gidA|nr:AsnC family transcriptional regulator [Chloroflexota bacterium]
MDETDRRILELLQQDGRRSNVEIARVLGISEGTVRKRIERLIAGGAVTIAGVASPEMAGYRTRALVFLTVELAQIERVANQLRDMPEVMSVYTVMGEYDIVLEAAFESDSCLMSFLRDRVATVPGIVGSKTCHVAHVCKSTHEWVPPQPPPPTVMVVDDDPDFVEFARLVLEKEGYYICTAMDCSEAVRMVSFTPVDLVMMDIQMDGVLDSWNASWRIRSDTRLRDVPILAVSSITASDYLSMFPTDSESPIARFLPKPVDADQLAKEVARLISRN